LLSPPPPPPYKKKKGDDDEEKREENNWEEEEEEGRAGIILSTKRIKCTFDQSVKVLVNFLCLSMLCNIRVSFYKQHWKVIDFPFL
jgi:hypothetical protein